MIKMNGANGVGTGCICANAIFAKSVPTTYMNVVATTKPTDRESASVGFLFYKNYFHSLFTFMQGLYPLG
jgi:hypothetical protein